MADRHPVKVLPDGGADSTGLSEFRTDDTVGVLHGGTGLSTVATSNILTGNGTSALSAETNLTFDGSLLAVTGEVNIGSEPTAAASSSDDLVVSTTGHTGITIFSGTSNEGILAFGDSADNDEGRLAFVHGDDYFKFIINDSEKLRVLSGGGITFNGDTAAANALDDYEEGTWVATSTPASGTITLINDSDGPTCSYTKIGRVVHAQGWVKVSSVSSPSGSWKISLPITPADLSESSGKSSGSVAVQNLSSAGESLVVHTYEGDATFTIASFDGQYLGGPASLVQANTELWFQVTYIA